jgi:hypothetical protein
MATLYRNAKEVKRIASDLMDEFPHMLGHLRGMRVEYLWRDKAQKKNQKTILGTASLVSGRHALLALKSGLNDHDWADGKTHAFFVIEIAEDEWKHLSEHQRRALVAHEMMHCGKDDDDEPMLIDHDLSEFKWIAQEFGLWKQDLIEFVNACAHHAQPQLPFDTEARFSRLDVDETTGEVLGDQRQGTTLAREFVESVRDLAPDGKELTRVGVSVNGGPEVVLTPETRQKLDRVLQQPGESFTFTPAMVEQVAEAGQALRAG